MDQTSDFMKRYLEQQRLRAQLLPDATAHNKQVLFDILQEAGVAGVTAEFDGYGDSGQMDSIAFIGPDAKERAAPAATVELHVVRHDGSGVDRVASSLAEAIESMAYALLDQEHAGWENNDGAYGSFDFDVAERTIRLEHNVRYTATETYEHDF